MMNLKEKIIHESLKLFSLKGLLSTSIHDILEAADTSKGGFYNHFSSKEDLFFAVLDEARRIWREKNLAGLDAVESPTHKITTLLNNYKDRYLKDAENFPGGCVFITLSAELNNQRPHLSKEIEKGFIGLKGLIKRLIDQGKESGEFGKKIDTDAVTEVLFNGMLGASLSYGVHKSKDDLDKSIKSLIEYFEQLEK
ncbi:MAG: TetR/AcrR family transcriptional regulator [Desulfobacterales bacterium]|nr:TetR/AcrR family transcriptional regulator [Desulfobacterales bacterium]